MPRLVDVVKGALVGSLITLNVSTIPSPAHRPQVGKFGTYYAKGYQICMADCIKQLALQKPAVPLEGDLVAVIEVVCHRPKTTKFKRPQGDVDNYAKAPMDAAKKALIWLDDVQVETALIDKRWTAPGELPGYTITIGYAPDVAQTS